MAVLAENEPTFPSFVPPCSFMSSASKPRAGLYKITQNRKIKVDIFYAAHHLRNPWQTQDLQETELLTSRITNQASSHMALLFKWLPCKSQNEKSDSSALPLTVSMTWIRAPHRTKEVSTSQLVPRVNWEQLWESLNSPPVCPLYFKNIFFTFSRITFILCIFSGAPWLLSRWIQYAVNSFFCKFYAHQQGHPQCHAAALILLFIIPIYLLPII